MVVAAAAATGVLSLYGTAALADSNAQSLAQGSPGVLSGNSIQVPVHVPVNVCGNSVDVAALLNAASGNTCANVESATPVAHAPRHAEPPAAPAPAPEVQLAETGSSQGAVGAATAAGGALLLGGAVLYRRTTRTARVRRAQS